MVLILSPDRMKHANATVSSSQDDYVRGSSLASIAVSI
jgi:hypothetical protein